MRYFKLSYNISLKTPVYPGDKPVCITRQKDISKGDSCNTSYVAFSNHAGTHIDAPKHFWGSGRPISDFSIGELIFKKPVLIDCPKEPSEAITIKDISNRLSVRDFDLILLRTGFGKYRNDEGIYCRKNPYLSPKAAGWLKDELKALRAIAIDCISISSYSNRDAGREAHKILLKADKSSDPVLIIEDICVPHDTVKLDEVIVVPIFIDGIDSAPATIIGVLYD